MADTEVNGRWQEKMSPYFEITEGAHPDQMFIELEEVFHLHILNLKFFLKLAVDA